MVKAMPKDRGNVSKGQSPAVVRLLTRFWWAVLIRAHPAYLAMSHICLPETSLNSALSSICMHLKCRYSLEISQGAICEQDGEVRWPPFTASSNTQRRGRQ